MAAMLMRIPDTLAGKRDRALLLLGFAAALRRSELVGLDVDDIERTPRQAPGTGSSITAAGKSDTDFSNRL